MEDSGELEAVVARVIAEHPDIVERIKGGNDKAMGALVGPVMRETKGRADGGEVNRLLRSQLGRLATNSAIWTRFSTSSLSSSRETCAFTVATLICSSAAISALAQPRPTASATSCSRGLSVCSRARASSRRPPSSATSAISLRATVGESVPSPAWTCSIARTISAGGVSFSRNPPAPARSARSTNSSASNVVSTITAGGDGCARSNRVASIPSSCGIRMSIRTTSGRCTSTAASTSRPSPASPTTSICAAPASIIRSPERTSASSSTSRTRITASPSGRSRRARSGRARAFRRPARRARPARSGPFPHPGRRRERSPSGG